MTSPLYDWEAEYDRQKKPKVSAPPAYDWEAEYERAMQSARGQRRPDPASDVAKGIVGDILATGARAASVGGKVGAAAARGISRVLGRPGPLERYAQRATQASERLSGLPEATEETFAPETRTGAVAKLATGVGKYLAMGPVTGTLMGSMEAAADPRFSQTALAGRIIPGPVGRFASRVAENPVGRAVGDAAINTALGKLIGKAFEKEATTPTLKEALAKGRVPQETPITDPNRLLNAAPPDAMHGPAIPMGGEMPRITDSARLLHPAPPDLVQGPAIPLHGEVPREAPTLQSLASVRPATTPRVELPSANTQAVRDAEATLRAASARRASGIDTRPMQDILRGQAGHVYSNPIWNPNVLRAALQSREPRGAAIAGVGLAMRQSDDENIRATGNGLIGLGLLHAVGMPRLIAAGKAAGNEIVDAVRDVPLARKVLNQISYDILAAPEVRAAVDAATDQAAIGMARATRVAQLTKGMTPEMRRAVSDVIEGEHIEPRIFSAPDAQLIAATAKKISDEFTALGREKVSSGLLSAQTVAKREGKYLPRYYAAFLTPEGERVPPTIQAQGRKIRIQGDKMRIEDLPLPVRSQLGEIREADLRATMGLAKGYQDVAAAKLFSALKTMPGVLHPDYGAAVDALLQAKQTGDRSVISLAKGVVESASHGAAKEVGYARLPDTPGLGVLRGAVVRSDVADYLNGVPSMKNTFGQAMTAWKKIHTIYNPGTQVGNFASNLVKYHMAGLPLHEQPAALVDASKALKTFDVDAQFLAEHGGLNHNYATEGNALPLAGKSRTRVLRELAATTRPETQAVLAEGGIKPYNTLQRLALKARDATERAYAWEDNVFAMAMFKKLKAQGVAPEAAATQVAQLNDFSTRSPLLGKVRDYASPFVLYTAKEAPRLLANIIEHPVRWMTLSAIWGGMDQFSRHMVGAVEQKDLRPDQRTNRFLGYLSPSTVQLPFNSPEGNKATIDVGRWTPLGALTGAPAPGVLGTQVFPAAPPILNPSGPIWDVGAALANTEAFTGDKLIKPGDTMREKARAVGGVAARMVLPSAASVHVPRVVTDLRSGDPNAAKTDVLGLLGMRPTYVRPGAQTAREVRALEDGIQNIRSDLRMELRRARTPEAQARAQRRAEERLRDITSRFTKEHR